MSRLDFLKNKYDTSLMDSINSRPNDVEALSVLSPEGCPSVVELFSSFDPSANKKYTQWMISMYMKNGFLLEDIIKFPETLDLFNRHNKKFPEEKRDINKFKYLDEILPLVEKYKLIEEETSDNKKKILEETEFFVNNQHMKILSPKTQEASNFWGAQTRWCTTSNYGNNTYFNSYNKKGPLYIFILENGQKFQFHQDMKNIEDVTFLNSSDHSFSIEYEFNQKQIEIMLNFFLDKNLNIDSKFKFNKWIPYLNSDMIERFLPKNEKLQEEIYNLPGNLIKEKSMFSLIENGVMDVHQRFLNDDFILKALNINKKFLHFIPVKFLNDDLMDKIVNYFNECVLPENYFPKESMIPKLIEKNILFYSFNIKGCEDYFYKNAFSLMYHYGENCFNFDIENHPDKLKILKKFPDKFYDLKELKHEDKEIILNENFLNLCYMIEEDIYNNQDFKKTFINNNYKDDKISFLSNPIKLFLNNNILDLETVSHYINQDSKKFFIQFKNDLNKDFVEQISRYSIDNFLNIPYNMITENFLSIAEDYLKKTPESSLEINSYVKSAIKEKYANLPIKDRTENLMQAIPKKWMSIKNWINFTKLVPQELSEMSFFNTKSSLNIEQYKEIINSIDENQNKIGVKILNQMAMRSSWFFKENYFESFLDKLIYKNQIKIDIYKKIKRSLPSEILEGLYENKTLEFSDEIMKKILKVQPNILFDSPIKKMNVKKNYIHLINQIAEEDQLDTNVFYLNAALSSKKIENAPDIENIFENALRINPDFFYMFTLKQQENYIEPIMNVYKKLHMEDSKKYPPLVLLLKKINVEYDNTIFIRHSNSKNLNSPKFLPETIQEIEKESMKCIKKGIYNSKIPYFKYCKDIEKYKETVSASLEAEDDGIKLKNLFKKYNSMSLEEQRDFMFQMKMYKNSEALLKQLRNQSDYSDKYHEYYEPDDEYEFRNPYLNTNR